MQGSLKQEWDAFWLTGGKEVGSESLFNLESHQGKITLDILRKFSPGKRILEAGCGIGNWVFLFEKLGFKTYGIDISFASLKKACAFQASSKIKAKFLQADIKILPFRGDSFDVIVSYGAVEHFPDTHKALEDFYRALKPSGVCLITTPNPYSFHRLIGRHILNITKNRSWGYIGYEDAYTPGELARMLKDAGFNRAEYGILQNGMGYLFGDFWPAIPLIGKFIFRALVSLSNLIESKQRIVGGGSFAIGYK